MGGGPSDKDCEGHGGGPVEDGAICRAGCFCLKHFQSFQRELLYLVVATMGDVEMENGASAPAEVVEDIPEIELIIKASTIDGRRKGACLFCQV